MVPPPTLVLMVLQIPSSIIRWTQKHGLTIDSLIAAHDDTNYGRTSNEGGRLRKRGTDATAYGFVPMHVCMYPHTSESSEALTD